jgi:hypothetical protein
MNPVFRKLNYKDQQVLHIINPPHSFKPALSEMEEWAGVKTTLTGAESVAFFLAFVTRQVEVDSLAAAVTPLLVPGALLWFAYPKGSSRKYSCDFNRDNGWNSLGKLGFEGVRMVAIDEDWSALRFKRAADIKSMTRSFAMSDEGKNKVASAKTKKQA